MLERTTTARPLAKRLPERNERGSALLLIPAGIVIVLALGAMTLNASLSYTAERNAASLASEVANDVATIGLDDEHFRSTGEYRLVPDLSSVAAWRIEAARSTADSAFVPGSTQIIVTRPAPDVVRVEVTARVELILRPPTGETTRLISASATATAIP